MKPTAVHLPPIYEGIAQSHALSACYDALLEDVRLPIEQMFILTAQEVHIWEAEIGIESAPDEDLDFRRARLINRYSQTGAFTMKFLHQALERLLPCPFEVYRNQALRTIYIKTELMQHKLLREFLHTMEAIVPLTMAYQLVLVSANQANAAMYFAGALSQCWRFTTQPQGQL